MSQNRFKRIDLTPLWHCPKLEALWLAENKLTQLNLAPFAHSSNLKTLNLTQNALTRLDISPILRGQQDFNLFIDPEVELSADARLKRYLWKNTPATFDERIPSISWFGEVPKPANGEPQPVDSSSEEVTTPALGRIISLEHIGKEFLTHLMSQGWLTRVETEGGFEYVLSPEGEVKLREIGLDL
jgi:hypothetical protein